jgi:hypothetical protein
LLISLGGRMHVFEFSVSADHGQAQGEMMKVQAVAAEGVDCSA